MSDAWEIKDEWTETLERVVEKFSDKGRKRRFKRVGYKMVARAKRKMTESKGFGNERPYKKLTIEWRRHGRKTLAANARNLAFAGRNPRSARVVSVRSGRSGGETIVGVSKVSKKRVTSASKPLIDRGPFRRSWTVLDLKTGAVIIGNDSEHHRNLASIHGDPTAPRTVMPERGNWDWGDKSADAAEAEYMKDFDKDIFD